MKFNALGKLVFECHSEEGNQRIDMSNQPEGIYFVQQQLGSSVKVLKVVIEN